MYSNRKLSLTFYILLGSSYSQLIFLFPLKTPQVENMLCNIYMKGRGKDDTFDVI